MSGVAIVLDEVTPLLQRVKTAAAAQGLAVVAARAVGGLVKEHLYGLDSQRHRFGNHYFRQAADSVTTGAVPQGAIVSVTQIGFRQRLKGGTINAKPGKALTLPEDDEAYGKRAREFNDLTMQRVINPETGALQMALVRNLSTPISIRRRKQKDGVIKTTITPGEVRGGEVMYWLVRRVTQRRDPTVLPYAGQMNERAKGAINSRLQLLQDRAESS